MRRCCPVKQQRGVSPGPGRPKGEGNLHRARAAARIRVLKTMQRTVQLFCSFAFSYRSSAYYRGGSGAAELVSGEVSE